MTSNGEIEKNGFKSLKLIFNEKEDLSNLQTRLDSAINHANERVNQYVQLRRMYLEINLTLMIVVTGILAIFLPELIKYSETTSDFDLLYFTILKSIIYFCIAVFNVIYNLNAHKTRFEDNSYFERFKSNFNNYFNSGTDVGDWRTNKFFRGNVPKKRKELKVKLCEFAGHYGFLPLNSNSDSIANPNVINEELLRNDVKNLYILFWFQKNYYNHAMWTRRFNLYSIIFLGLNVLIFLIMYSVKVIF